MKTNTTVNSLINEEVLANKLKNLERIHTDFINIGVRLDELNSEMLEILNKHHDTIC